MKRADVNWNMDADLCQQVIGGAPALWQKAGKMLSSGFAVFGVIEDAEILAHELLAEHSADAGRQLESLTARVAAAAPDAAPLFPLGLLGAMLPQALAYMRSMGADDTVCRSTFGDILRWVSRYETLHGEPGVDEFGWIVLPYAGRIFEIGSLQYQMFCNPWPVYGWTDQNGHILLLADKGVHVAADGYVAGTNGSHRDIAFTTAYQESGDMFTGHRYDAATGAVCADVETFSMRDYAKIFAPGSPALNMHIPAKADLNAAAIDTSLAGAHDFFKRIQYPCTVALCESWLLDPQLLQWLYPGSSIAGFAARFARFRVYSAGSWGHRFLFGSDRTPDQITDADAKTSLQKAVLRHWRSGGALYDTGGVIKISQDGGRCDVLYN